MDQCSIQGPSFDHGQLSHLCRNDHLFSGFPSLLVIQCITDLLIKRRMSSVRWVSFFGSRSRHPALPFFVKEQLPLRAQRVLPVTKTRGPMTTETLKINDGTTMEIARLPDVDDATWAELKAYVEGNPETAKTLQSFAKNPEAPSIFFKGGLWKENCRGWGHHFDGFWWLSKSQNVGVSLYPTTYGVTLIMVT